MNRHRPTVPRESRRAAAFRRLANGRATPEDYLIGMERPLAYQRALAIRMTGFSIVIALLARFLAHGSLPAACMASAIIMAVSGLNNRDLYRWLYTGFCLLVDPPSRLVRRRGLQLAGWSWAADIGPMFFMLLALRQAGIIPFH